MSLLKDFQKQAQSSAQYVTQQLPICQYGYFTIMLNLRLQNGCPQTDGWCLGGFALDDYRRAYSCAGQFKCHSEWQLPTMCFVVEFFKFIARNKSLLHWVLKPVIFTNSKKSLIMKKLPFLTVKATYVLPQVILLKTFTTTFSSYSLFSLLVWQQVFRNINSIFLFNNFDFTAPVRMTNPNPGEHLNSRDLLVVLSLSCSLSFFAQILICRLGN